MSNEQSQVEDLKARLAALTQRVYTLEKRAGITPGATGAPTPSRPVVPSPQRPAVPIPSFLQPSEPVTPADVAAKTFTPDLETKIGGEWLNRIGIAAVLIGVSYFIKLAFDNNWVGPAGRVSIGLIAGLAVVWWSERFRGSGHTIFSYSLKAVGIGTLYLSLWGAFHLYALVPAPVAFGAMIVVTAFTAALAVKQDAEILAAFAIAGGFTTPVLLSTGVDHGLQLFCYVTVLDVATLALIALKPWKRLVLGSFTGTLLLYAGWYDRFYSEAQLPLALSFATAFFLIFFVAPLASRQKLSTMPNRPGSISITLVTLIFLNALVYFLQAYAIMDRLHHQWIAWFAVALAGMYLGLSRELRTHVPAASQKQSALPLVHIAIAVAFLTIAVPLKLETHWITLGWLVESAVLLYIGEKGDSWLIRVLGLSALILGIGRLVLVDDFSPQTLVFNSRFLAYLVAMGVLGMIASQAHKSLNHKAAAGLAAVGISLLFLYSGSREITDYYARLSNELNAALPGNYGLFRNVTLARDFTYSAFWMIYGGIVMAVGFWKRSAFLRWQAMILIGITCVKVFVYDVSELDKGYRVVSLIALGVILLAISYAYQRDWLKLSGEKKEPISRPQGAAS